jgi:hypothetical protein
MAAMRLAVGPATSVAEATRVAIVTAAVATRTEVGAVATAAWVAVATVKEALRVTVEVEAMAGAVEAEAMVVVADNSGNKARNESSWPQSSDWRRHKQRASKSLFTATLIFRDNQGIQLDPNRLRNGSYALVHRIHCRFAQSLHNGRKLTFWRLWPPVWTSFSSLA